MTAPLTARGMLAAAATIAAALLAVAAVCRGVVG